MLAKRIIPCLDVRDGKVVKGIGFRQHRIVGDILELAEYYSLSGADELVFYDITASCEGRTVSLAWIEQVAERINIPFCVAGGIRTVEHAKKILRSGADKVSINTPALENPALIGDLAEAFGVQCVVVGVDSHLGEDGAYHVWRATGSEKTARKTPLKTLDWIASLRQRGAGEVVLNCMNHDGVRKGYDIEQLSLVRQTTSLPLIASGGAGSYGCFEHLLQQVRVDGALAASVFHNRECLIGDLKARLLKCGVAVRPPDALS